MKKTVKNLITNVNDMRDIGEKSLKIKDSSYQFQKDSEMIEKKIKYLNLTLKFIVISIIEIIFILILYFIIK